jgi:hypothetical protein
MLSTAFCGSATNDIRIKLISILGGYPCSADCVSSGRREQGEQQWAFRTTLPSTLPADIGKSAFGIPENDAYAVSRSRDCCLPSTTRCIMFTHTCSKRDPLKCLSPNQQVFVFAPAQGRPTLEGSCPSDSVNSRTDEPGKESQLVWYLPRNIECVQPIVALFLGIDPILVQ